MNWRRAILATKKNEVQVMIPEIKLQQAQIRIVGTSPLVVHKFSEKAKRQMLEKQMKTAKTSAKEAKNPVEDFMQVLYWLTPMPQEFTEQAFMEAVAAGARFAFPTTGIKASIVSAAYRADLVKNKVSLFGCFHLAGEMTEIKGVAPVMREDTVRLQTGVADIRFRPEFAPGWFMDLDFTFNAALLSLDQLVSFVTLGGFAVGIGENRIEKGGQWGAYKVAEQ
jgi:hypothetical protein